MNLGQDDLQQKLNEAIVRHKVAGASMAVFDKGRLITAAAGTANIVSGAPLTTDTIVHIGSICKVFNATLVMQLVDDGLLDLDDSILTYLSDLPWRDRDAAGKTTVRMLLNHTSGINGSTLPDTGPDEETVEKAVRRIAQLDELFAPGEECSYCNPGTVLAGYIVGRLRQKSWYTVVRERIFEPLEMRQAISLPAESLLYSAAVGHFTDPVSGELVRTTRALLPLGYGPAGATLMMTASDLVTFARAHMGYGVGANGVRILSERSAREMQRVSVDNSGRGYWLQDMGIGWMRSTDGLLNHNGGAPGAVSHLYAHPERDFAVAVLTNTDHGGGMIYDLVLPMLQDWSTTKVGGVFHEDDVLQDWVRPPEAYVGTFEDPATIYRVTRTDAGLDMTYQAKFPYYDSISTEETAPAPLEHIGGEKFVWRAAADVAGSPRSTARLMSFRGSDDAGRARHIGNKNHLYVRRSD